MPMNSKRNGHQVPAECRAPHAHRCCNGRTRPGAGVGCLAVCLLLAGVLPAAGAAEVGTVVMVRGVATAALPEGSPRFIGKGSTLSDGETLTIGARSFALLKMADGTRMTLRENTVISLDEFSADEGKESMLFSLFRGGLRALTGLISKRSADAFKIHTPAATIGIRGTDFDARLCADDCAVETRELADEEVTTRSQVVARVVLVRGEVQVVDAYRGPRRLVRGGPVYQGETLETGASAMVLLAFTDRSRLTLGPRTRFLVGYYRHQPEQPEDSGMLLRLLRGGLRMVTGLIAQTRPESISVSTPVATIGIRGTGFDLFCEGACAAAGRAEPTGDEASAPTVPAASAPGSACDGEQDLVAHVWQGEIGLRQGEQVYSVGTDQTLCVPPAASPLLLTDTPDFVEQNTAPRPDGVEVDFEQLFGARAGSEDRPGLYVAVRDDGHVSVVRGDEVLDIGGGETAYVDPGSGELVRLVARPVFMEFDPAPLPSEFERTPNSLIQLFDEGGRRPGEGPMQCTM